MEGKGRDAREREEKGRGREEGEEDGRKVRISTPLCQFLPTPLAQMRHV